MTLRLPTPREKIYDYYWYFASERQSAFERRVAGLPAPWTDDAILQTFKFCNVFRAADRVSQYMIREVCYHDEPCTPEDRLKHLNHVELFRHMFLTGSLGERLLAAQSLRQVYDLLHAYPLMGDFMSYQTTIDLNYSGFINFSENEFTQAGPGALRGIKKCFEILGDYKPTDVILWMVDNQEKEMARLGLPFNGLWGRPLYAIDCQGLFCETDKYCREAAPELASARKRIKARFTQSTEPIELFFPPKWGSYSAAR